MKYLIVIENKNLVTLYIFTKETFKVTKKNFKSIQTALKAFELVKQEYLRKVGN